MRVLVNELQAFKAKSGIGHYTTELLRHMRLLAPEVRWDRFPSRWVWKTRSLVRRLRSWLPREAGPARGGAAGGGAPVGRGLALARRLGWAILETDFRIRAGVSAPDIYHEPNNIPLPTDVPTVVTIHDLSVLLHPEWHPAYRAAEYEARFRRGLAQCRHVLTDSEFIRQELIHILNLDAARVTHAPLGVRPGLGPLPDTAVRATLRRLGLPPQYFLYLSTIEPRKNVMTLLRAYVKLPAEVRDRFPLLLVGGWGWKSDEVAAFLHDQARHRGVVYAGYLPEPDLAAVLNGARALAYPSFYEGFGLPPVEMMACGGAVLCSTAGALVETVGARAHLVEALDEDGWRDALRRVAVDDDWHAELRRGAVDVARPFTWERCAADTLAVYRRVCGDKTLEQSPRRKAA